MWEGLDMIVDDETVTGGISGAELTRATGWEVRPEGLCRGPVCVPLPAGARPDEDTVDLRVAAERLGMALVPDPEGGVWALGPESGGRALTSATAPGLTLPEAGGNPFDLASLHGRKVLLIAWASW